MRPCCQRKRSVRNAMTRMKRFAERIRRLEKAMRTLSIVAPECICFPENEQPFFGQNYDRDLAFAVKWPLHGDRFQSRPLIRCWMAKRTREDETTDPEYPVPKGLA